MEFIELNNSEKILTRSLYEEAFFEDSKKFVDFYYKQIQNNRVFVCKEDDEIISMIHLHPMTIKFRNIKFDTYYIIAVATQKLYRKRGIYARLLRYTLNVLDVEKVPIVFLMPAKEEIYKPFNFETLVKFNSSIITRNDKSYDFESLNLENKSQIKLLSEKYLDCYIDRNDEYIDTQIDCLEAMDGAYYFVKQQEKYVGYLRYVGEEKFILDVVCEPAIEEDIVSSFANYMNFEKIKVDLMKNAENNDNKTNKYMYRIINLEAFIDLIKEIDYSKIDEIHNIKLIDNLIESNNKSINCIENTQIQQMNISDFLIEILKRYKIKPPFIHEVI